VIECVVEKEYWTIHLKILALAPILESRRSFAAPINKHAVGLNGQMAIEALRQSRDRDTLSREWERLGSSPHEEATTQGLDHSMSNSAGDANGDGRAAGEEIELELNS
jgi:hypothetical protein